MTTPFLFASKKEYDKLWSWARQKLNTKIKRETVNELQQEFDVPIYNINYLKQLLIQGTSKQSDKLLIKALHDNLNEQNMKCVKCVICNVNKISIHANKEYNLTSDVCIFCNQYGLVINNCKIKNENNQQKHCYHASCMHNILRIVKDKCIICMALKLDELKSNCNGTRFNITTLKNDKNNTKLKPNTPYINSNKLIANYMYLNGIHEYPQWNGPSLLIIINKINKKLYILTNSDIIMQKMLIKYSIPSEAIVCEQWYNNIKHSLLINYWKQACGNELCLTHDGKHECNFIYYNGVHTNMKLIKKKKNKRKLY